LTTKLTSAARRLPEATLVVDSGGVEAERFGVATSGTVLWFDAQGRVLYAGGLTMARGHEGRTTGSDQLANLMRGDSHPAQGIPVFGCQLCLPTHK
jgi:hypothetical protein